MNVEDYDDLPDCMHADEVAACFERLLREAEEPGVTPESVFEALWHLADRQYHTYQMLREDLRDQIDQWIGAHWRPTPDNVDYIGTIAGGIGLPGVIQVLESSLSEEMSDGLRSELEETLEAIRDHIEDPYRDLRALPADLERDKIAVGGRSGSFPLAWILDALVVLVLVVVGVVVLR